MYGAVISRRVVLECLAKFTLRNEFRPGENPKNGDLQIFRSLTGNFGRTDTSKISGNSAEV